MLNLPTNTGLSSSSAGSMPPRSNHGDKNALHPIGLITLALGGHLKPSDKIQPLLKSATASFGITALNELQQLYNGKSIVEDGQFALEVMLRNMIATNSPLHRIPFSLLS